MLRRIIHKRPLDKQQLIAVTKLSNDIRRIMVERNLEIAIVHVFFNQEYTTELWLGEYDNRYCELVSEQLAEFIEENIGELIQGDDPAFYEIFLAANTLAVGFLCQIGVIGGMYATLIPLCEVEPGALLAESQKILEEVVKPLEAQGISIEPSPEEKPYKIPVYRELPDILRRGAVCNCQGPKHEIGCHLEPCPLCHKPLLGGICKHALGHNHPKTWAFNSHLDCYMPPDEERIDVPTRST